jgi:hypothetical protein
MGTTKKKAAKLSKHVTSDGHSYLTKRIMVAKARSAGIKAAANAMQVMGFVVVAEGNTIIKKHADGAVEVIGLIENTNV